jgi:hypothetical protein
MYIAMKRALTTRNQLLCKNMDFAQFQRDFYNMPAVVIGRHHDVAVHRL